jgi:hypothetical protein
MPGHGADTPYFGIYAFWPSALSVLQACQVSRGLARIEACYDGEKGQGEDLESDGIDERPATLSWERGLAALPEGE